eukprot:gene22822-29993_t
MSFVSVGGDDSTKPTYFEVVAADRLVPSLRAATVYTLSVVSQRLHWVHRLLSWEDEVVALGMLLLDWRCLGSTDGTFAEGLYGLRRRKLGDSSTSSTDSASSTSGGTSSTSVPQPAPAGNAMNQISRRQRTSGLLLQVFLSYLRTKLDRLYKLHSNSRASSSESLASLKRVLLRTFMAAYPIVHALCEATNFSYQLSYLLGISDCHSPVLRVLGMSLARISGNDMMLEEHQKERMHQEQKKNAIRRQRFESIQSGSPAVQRLYKLLLGGYHFVADHSRNSLMLAVFGFKALEWWYTSAEERLAMSKALPPPPPPPVLQPSPSGLALPSDPALCPFIADTCQPGANPQAVRNCYLDKKTGDVHIQPIWLRQ